MFEVVLFPILQTYGFETVFESGSMTLLILATVLIAAGGNVLNDYFDIKIDLINRPDKVIVGNIISRPATMIYYQILTGLGILCGLYLAYIASSFTLCFIFIIVPGLLWFYSASYKRQFLTGNLIVAFMAALSILVVGITQLAFLEKVYGNLIFETPIPSIFYGWIGGFALFAFLCTWIREIIKDIEDEIGDREMECRTMPIKWGIAKTKLFLYALIILTVAGLFVINGLFIHFEGSLTIRYIIFGLAIPFIALIYMIFAAKSVADFHQASTLSKVIMLIGILYSFVFYFLQAKMYGISIFNIFILK
ncbi:MAG: geranylgeranylglycerol-phosphate geranylgeranyltransferase [Bacteroidales bacterium]